MPPKPIVLEDPPAPEADERLLRWWPNDVGQMGSLMYQVMRSNLPLGPLVAVMARSTGPISAQEMQCLVACIRRTIPPATMSKRMSLITPRSPGCVDAASRIYSGEWVRVARRWRMSQTEDLSGLAMGGDVSEQARTVLKTLSWHPTRAHPAPIWSALWAANPDLEVRRQFIRWGLRYEVPPAFGLTHGSNWPVVREWYLTEGFEAHDAVAIAGMIHIINSATRYRRVDDHLVMQMVLRAALHLPESPFSSKPLAQDAPAFVHWADDWLGRSAAKNGIAYSIVAEWLGSPAPEIRAWAIARLVPHVQQRSSLA